MVVVVEEVVVAEVAAGVAAQGVAAPHGQAVAHVLEPQELVQRLPADAHTQEHQQ